MKYYLYIINKITNTSLNIYHEIIITNAFTYQTCSSYHTLEVLKSETMKGINTILSSLLLMMISHAHPIIIILKEIMTIII